MRKAALRTLRMGVFGLWTVGFSACNKGEDSPLSSLGKMTISGSVKKAGSGEAIEGATVRLIKLLDADAIKNLVEVAKIPDGAGGKKDRLRIKLSKVHEYPADAEGTTDASGAFSIAAPIQAYLVYTFGPGAAPGTPGSYTVNFWGINPETGEIALEHLIGKDGKLQQKNDAITLAGGPTPPPVPEPTPPPPPPAVSTETPPTTPPAEPTVADPAKPEEVVPPAVDSSFWKTDISLVHSTGTLSKDTPAADEVALVEGQRYLDVTAELSSAQSEPVKLVMQVGFDTADIPNCQDTSAAGKTYIYDVMPNGTTVAYKLVPPGPYYKIFFAKSATREEGKPVTAESPTAALTVGKRDCLKARPERPFMATLTWDKNSVDLDLHVISADRRDVFTNKQNAKMTDLANWTAPKGVSLSLDVDNLVGYGPENVGENTTVTDPNAKCYAVQVNAFAGGNFPTTAKVDITQLTMVNGVYTVERYSLSQTMTAQGEWWQVGIFPPSCMSKEPEALPKEEPRAVVEAKTGCEYPEAFASLDASKDSMFAASGTFDGQSVSFSCKYENVNRRVVGNNAQTFDYTPSAPSGDAPVSITATCTAPLGSKTVVANVWLLRVGTDTKGLEANTKPSEYPYVQVTVSYNDNSKIFKTPNAYGSTKKTTFVSGSGSLETLEKQADKLHKPKKAKGCFTTEWTEEGGGEGELTGYFDLNYIK